MHITLFESATDTRPQNYDVDWQQLIALLTEWGETVRCHRSDKLRYFALLPGLCEGARANANVRFLSALCADFDLGPADPRYLTFQDFCDRLERDDLAFFAYTTTKNCRAANKFRVMLPYARPVPLTHCRMAWQACQSKFNGAIDNATKDPARLSFLPAQWLGATFHDGTRGTITLEEPFNATRANPNGKPILSHAEIHALTPGALQQSPGTQATKPPTECEASPLSESDREALMQGKHKSDPCWPHIGNLHTSPLITRWMREELPRREGNRDYNFLLSASRQAVAKGFPISVEILCRLAEQFSREMLCRSPPADLHRQAENALSYAVQQHGKNSEFQMK